MSTRSFKEATKALQRLFTAAQCPLALPPETRRMLQDFVNDQQRTDNEKDLDLANTELRSFWERYVGENPQKLGLLAGVLRELWPAISAPTAIWEWWMTVIRPVIGSPVCKRAALDDARAFVVGVMTAEVDDSTPELARISNRICNDLLKMYLAHSRPPTDDQTTSASENAQIAQQIEDALVAFGRKKPKQIFTAIDSLVVSSSSRLQALSLLNSFLRYQTPHTYCVAETPLLEHLIQCLANDTSTTSLSMALTSLIMLLPHVAGSVRPYLPRLFLIYTRLLCWERFSSLSTAAERNTVTDDRVANEVDEEGQDPGNVGRDASWTCLQPEEGAIDASTPELLNYFTYLYGLFPLNFMSYIRKSRRYLKDHDVAGADAFDLESEVIRRRSEQFRKMHLMHPNFCNLTIEEELSDSKWSKMDPADVVGECHSLCVHKMKGLASPGPPPSGRLPDVPLVPPLSATSKASGDHDSPALESLRSAHTRYDSGSGPTSRPQSSHTSAEDQRRIRKRSSGTTLRTSTSTEDFLFASGDHAGNDVPPPSSLSWLQREVQLLKSDLNFERWHKAQYSQHIGQITNRNVKNATIEAEQLNLLNANKALKHQLEQVQKAREATIKDSVLTRKQANSHVANMEERMDKIKLEQEKWRLDNAELMRLRSEMPRYRDLLVAAEARELNTKHALQIVQRELEKLQTVQSQLHEMKKRVREYEYKEFEFEHTIREREILENEKQLLQMKVQRYDDERERMKRTFTERVADLEAQLSGSGQAASQGPADSQALADTQTRLLQLRKAHSRLLENYTDLELDYQAARSQLEAFPSESSNGRDDRLRPARSEPRPISNAIRSNQNEPIDFGFEFVGEYNPAETSYALPSASEPSPRRQNFPGCAMPPASLAGSEPTVHSSAGLTFQAPTPRGDSIISRSSGSVRAQAFNPSAPLEPDEGASVYSKSQDGSSTKKSKVKIEPDSQLRVYGRGGAQNIKLKAKDSTKEKSDSSSTKKSVLRGLRGLS